jgi:dynein heavy chain 2, cytosolic
VDIDESVNSCCSTRLDVQSNGRTCRSLCVSSSFLGKRGVKEEIMNFDPRNVTVENRESVEQLLRKKADSFSADNAAKASQVAGPLAAWVTANVKYSRVLERIRPLEDKQNKLKKYLSIGDVASMTSIVSFVVLRSLENSTRKMDELSDELRQVDDKVERYRTTFEKSVETTVRRRSLIDSIDLERRMKRNV